MPNVIDYALLQRSHSQYLTEAVQKLVEKGWQPYGQPFNAGGDVVQAVVLYEGYNDLPENLNGVVR